MDPIIFTIASANYVPYARVLMASVRAQHPGAMRYLILADEGYQARDGDSDLFTVIRADAMPVPHFHHFAFRYSILEFNTALKPYAFSWIAVRHPANDIVYLDPDIFVLSPLDEVTHELERGALAVLTPHLTAPLEDLGHPSELDVMRTGVYNLGFCACGRHPDRARLLEWWCEKLEFAAAIDKDAGLFTDQKWMDLVPGLFKDVVVLRNPGYNIAYWNLAHRRTQVDDAGALLANGQRVSFVHFSGIDVNDPDRFAKHQDRFTSRSIGALKGWYRRYLGLLANAGGTEPQPEYAFGRLRDGTVITPALRAAFRRWYDIGRELECSDPFGLSPRDLGRRYGNLIKSRPLLVESYKRARAGGLVRLVDERLIPKGTGRREWVKRVMRVSHVSAVLSGYLPPVRIDRPSGADAPLDWGDVRRPRANLIGYLTGEFGIAEGARLLSEAARLRGVELSLIRVEAGGKREDDRRLEHLLSQQAPQPVSIYIINADQISGVMSTLGDSIVASHYNIGYWAWELSRFPSAWQDSVDLVDEIWTPSRFVATSVRTITRKRIRVMRQPVDIAPSRLYVRREFGLPDDPFLFLFTLDFHSFVARKNPIGVIEAFRKAFKGDASGVALLIKSTNGDATNYEYRRLQDAASGDPRILLMDGYLSRDEVYGLESVADAYVSLHRSEGLGLGMAESMALGKPVIATAYSGNLEYMDSTTACLVGYRLRDVRPGEYLYPSGQVWAEPDIDHAAALMRTVARDRAFSEELGRRAKAHIAAEFGFAKIGEDFRALLGTVYEDNAPDVRQDPFTPDETRLTR